MKVVVVIPAYNARTTIRGAIQSVLDQKHIDANIVAVDHGSSDGTQEVLAQFSEEGLLDFIPLQRRPREKRSASRPLDRGIRHGLSSISDPARVWFMRLDADDILSDRGCIASLLNGAGEAKLLIGRLVFFNAISHFAESYNVAPRYRSKAALLDGAAYSVPHHASFIRADLMSAVVRARGFAFDRRIGYGEDLDLTLALVAACKAEEIVFNDRDVCFKRLDGHTISNTASLNSMISDHIRVLNRHNLLGSALALSVSIDLTMQLFRLHNHPVRSKFGYPGKRWALIKPFRLAEISDRLKVLNDMLMPVRNDKPGS